MASKPWVDHPIELIKTPCLTRDESSHSAVVCASEMAHAHNTLIRGFNALYLQGPNVKTPEDIKDYLYFCVAWVLMVEHHHETEETTMFPALEKLTNDPGIMRTNKVQHLSFMAGMHTFLEYARTTRPEDYDWQSLKTILDGFAPALFRHLREEIPTLLGLDKYDSDAAMSVWKEVEKMAKGAKPPPNLFDTIFPLVMGCVDKTYEGGIHKFPPFPFFFPYLIDYWFARTHRGSWRFCPCDMYGQPRELPCVESA